MITAANVPDMRVVGELLDARVLRAPAGTEQHACLDKDYDYADAERAVRRRRYVPHIRRRGDERQRCRRDECARRWVVERTHSKETAELPGPRRVSRHAARVAACGIGS